MMKTEKEIQKTIKAMDGIRGKVKPYSIFGDDNLATFDACLEVLQEDLDEDEIAERWDPDDEYNIWSSAQATRDWWDGENDDFDPVKNWPLVKGA